MKEQSIDLLARLCNAHSAPGFESGVRQIFKDSLPSYNIGCDKLGSIYAESPDIGPNVCLFGHMDEVGFMVQAITEEGFIRFTTLGGWWGHTLLSQRVRIQTRSGEEHIGVICSIPTHFLTADSKDKVMSVDQMFIDIGATTKNDIEDNFGIKLGDSIVPDSQFTQLGKTDRYVAKAFDNRVGMGLCIQTILALESIPLPYKLIAAGTVQEEVGTRGAETLSRLIKPDLAFILEGPPADDAPGFNLSESQGKLGGGVQIRLLDPSAIMNRDLADYVISVAEQNNINHQVTVRRSGGTDAKAVQRYDIGVPTVVLGVPARYIHSHNSIIDINDYLSALELLSKILRDLNPDKISKFTSFID